MTLLEKTLKVLTPYHEGYHDDPENARRFKEVLEDDEVVGEFLREYHARFMPKKCGDPGGFVITIQIRNQPYQALCDPGASASLLPLAIWKDLNTRELKPSRMKLGMADGSYVTPSGSAEDVLVQLKGFYIPEDFMIADIKVDRDAPILLGRPFLTTVGAKMDMKKGRMTFDICGEELEFIIGQGNHEPL